MSTQTVEAWVPEPPSSETFAKRLRLLRLGMGDLSVKEMARRTGIPTPTWRKWEQGVRPQNMGEVVRKIHDATGVDMAWLMWGRPDQGSRSPTWKAYRPELRLVS